MRRRLFVLALLWAGHAEAAIFTVGSDAACTHASVLAAVVAAVGNGPGMDEIRVATNHTDTGTIAPIASHSVHVRGGFSDCSDTTPGAATVLVGTPTGTNGTFSTSGTGDSYSLILENLQLRDGGNNARRGGALRVEGRFLVELRNVTLSNNRAGRGGGIYLDGSDGAGIFLTQNSLISENVAAVSGGGIHCQDGGVVLMISGTLVGNSAEDGTGDPIESGNGGGVALHGCSMVQSGQGGISGVLANSAARYGGGYYLRGGSILTLDGSADGPAYVLGNEAVEGGGGIGINDPLPLTGPLTSQVAIHNSRIESNYAPYGGGLGLFAGGDVLMRRTLAENDCHSLTHCSTLSGNDRYDEALPCLGAAVFAAEGARVRLWNTRIDGNCPADSGWTFRQRLDSRIEIDSSLILANGGASPFFIEGSGATTTGGVGFDGLLQIAWSTVYGHFETVVSGMFTLPSSASTSEGTLRAYGSILGERFLSMNVVGGLGSPPPMTLDYDCLIVDSVFDGPTSAARIAKVAAPYGMANPAGGNYQAASGTAAPVDYCDESRGPRAAGDFLGRTGVFDSARVGGFGLHDAGAYERQEVPPTGDIFADGFESP